jgi:hypothetical protein
VWLAGVADGHLVLADLLRVSTVPSDGVEEQLAELVRVGGVGFGGERGDDLAVVANFEVEQLHADRHTVALHGRRWRAGRRQVGQGFGRCDG